MFPVGLSHTHGIWSTWKMYDGQEFVNRKIWNRYSEKQNYHTTYWAISHVDLQYVVWFFIKTLFVGKSNIESVDIHPSREYTYSDDFFIESAIAAARMTSSQ